MKEHKTSSGEQTQALGADFAAGLSPGAVVCMHGPLGAGKTTFIQGVASFLGIQEAVTSPTFTIASAYEGTLPLYHIDVYRIDSTEEFELLGLEEYIYGKGVTFIEWSEKVEEALPPRLIHITISINDDGTRTIVIDEPEEEP